MTEKQFFEFLLKNTGQVFQNSPIQEYQVRHNKNWNYSICETPIQKGKGLIFGLNWGGDNINTQSQYPVADKERNWNFMSNGIFYFKKYLTVKSIDEINYSNLCFFRSPNIKYLTWKDWELSVPLFKTYVDYITPTWTVLLGKTGVRILNELGHLKDLSRIEVKGKRNRTFGYTGLLFDKYNFYCVPHPQTRIATEVRDEIWHLLFTQEKPFPKINNQ